MKFLLCFLALTLYSSVYSSDGSEKPFKRVYIGVAFTPEASYRYLAATGGSSSLYQSLIQVENKQASPDFGVGASAKVGINITHLLAIESGIGYTLARYRPVTNQPLTYGSSWNGSSYSASDSSLTEKEIYHYVTIPIGLRFSFGHKRVRGIIVTGADLDFLLKQTQVISITGTNPHTESNTPTDQTKTFNTFNLSPFLGTGIDCYLSPAAVLRIMPVAQIQSLKNINTPISEYLWNVGLNVSFFFGL